MFETAAKVLHCLGARPPVPYTEYSNQVQITGEQLNLQLKEQLVEQHAGGHAPTSHAGLAYWTFMQSMQPTTDWTDVQTMNMPMCLGMVMTSLKLKVHNILPIFGCLITVCLTNVHAGPRITTRGSSSTSGSSSTTTYPKAKDFTANMQDKWDYLPGMKRWDGVPNYEFVTVWIAALIVALGYFNVVLMLF